MQILKNALWIIFLQAICVVALGAFLLVGGRISFEYALGVLLAGIILGVGSLRAAAYLHKKDIHIDGIGFFGGLAFFALTLVLLGYFISVQLPVFTLFGILAYLPVGYFIKWKKRGYMFKPPNKNRTRTP